MEETDDEYRSRVMSLMMMSFGLMPIAVVPLGFAVKAYGAQASLLGMAIALLVVSALFAAFSSRIRQME